MMIPNKVARVFTKEKQKLNSSTITKKIIERKLKKNYQSLPTNRDATNINERHKS